MLSAFFIGAFRPHAGRAPTADLADIVSSV
jgi:hypothetical protein